jgi:hypothetical protein
MLASNICWAIDYRDKILWLYLFFTVEGQENNSKSATITSIHNLRWSFRNLINLYRIHFTPRTHRTTSFRILKDEEQKMKRMMKNIWKRTMRRKGGGRRCWNYGKTVCFHIIFLGIIKICHSTEMISFHDLGLKVNKLLNSWEFTNIALSTSTASAVPLHEDYLPGKQKIYRTSRL